MDAVELPLPAAVSVSKLMGSDGFGGVGGGAGATVKKVEARESDRVSILASPSVNDDFFDVKDEVAGDGASEPAFWDTLPEVEPCRRAKPLQKKSCKVARNSSGSSKRSRMAHMQVSVTEHGADDLKRIANELGSYATKCNTAEQSQMPKQKNSVTGKRGDKRNGKVAMKSRYDSFSLKTGLLSFSSSGAGSNILGVHGSKQDIFDITKHEEELSLAELLDGSYKCPSFARDKGKKAANLNDNIVNLVSDACSILRLRKPVQPQNFAETDNSYNQKVSTCLGSSGSCLSTRNDSDKGDSYTKEQSSSNKFQDSCSKLKSHSDLLDLPSYQPEDILQRLTLPPAKDLDSLLLDATKPAVPLKNHADIRFAKGLSHRPGLPPFPWSHSSGGHYKSNSDSVKLSTSRTTCQGRWVKIGSSGTSVGDATSFLVDFESLTYDHSLVPSADPKLGSSEIENVPSTFLISHSSERDVPLSAKISVASQFPPESGSSLKFQDNAEHSPGVLAAAQTLCDIATNSLRQNTHEMKWPKKPSQKSMKARKLKSNEKSEEIFAVPDSVTRTDYMQRNTAELLPAKKPRFSVNEKSNDFGHSNINTSRKVPMKWSSSRSSRSSPSNLVRESVAEIKHFNANTVKQSWMMPPSARVSDKASEGQRKLRKIEWNNW